MKYSQIVIKYPNGARQVVKPGPQFQGDWDTLAKSIAGLWFRDAHGNVTHVPYELK
jgi:hypothetical protein